MAWIEESYIVAERNLSNVILIPLWYINISIKISIIFLKIKEMSSIQKDPKTKIINLPNFNISIIYWISI